MFKSFKEKLAGLFKSKKEVVEKPEKEKEKQEEPEKKAEKQPEEKQPEEKPQKIQEKQEKPQEKQPEPEKTPEQQIEQKKQDLEQENKQEIDYLIEEAVEETEEKAEKEQAKTKEKAEKKQPIKKQDKKLPTEEKSPGFFSKAKTKLTSVHLDQKTFDEFFEKLEMLLIENNVALLVIDRIRQDMEKRLLNIEIKKSELEGEIRTALKQAIEEILIEPFDLIDLIKKHEQGPFIILFFGINGSGKTTTISKIANLLKQNNISSVFAAGDTFRAASIEQLIKHGEKLGVRVIHQDYGSDPAAVAFDAIQYAKTQAIKTVLIDTAGRMHTKHDLLREMEKIVRVTQPNLKIFVAESITGNDATEQARNFNETFGIDATILTKADVDEKGGTAISIGHVTEKPIIFLGTGQGYKDLEKFDVKEVLAGLGLD